MQLSFAETLLSYRIPQGVVADGLDLRDSTYDGSMDNEGRLAGGLGQLFDGVTGRDNFETHPQRWVGWRRDLIGSHSCRYTHSLIRDPFSVLRAVIQSCNQHQI